jgi:parallel beta-helix repeat protein
LKFLGEILIKKAYSKITITVFSLFLLIILDLNFFKSFNFSENVLIFKNESLNYSATFYSNETTIIIIGNEGWTLASDNDWCKGSGTSSNPYLIKNITLTGLGGGYCLRVRDSDVYFTISNCTFSNATFGIILIDVYNGKLTNNIIYNNAYGIYVQNCYEINVSDNKVFCNLKYGIFFYGRDKNTINRNLINNNLESAVYLEFSKDNIILRNDGCFNGINGIILFYFSINNTIVENNISFNRGDGIKIRYGSNFNIILMNSINNNNDNGISLVNCNNISISKNIINENTNYGIFFQSSNFSKVINNNLINNKDCIYEENCQGNLFKENFPCYYGEKNDSILISGYRISFLILLLCLVTFSLIRKVKLR